MGIIMGMRAPNISQLNLTSAMLNLIAELDEFKGRWSLTQILAPERLMALRQIATIESVGSSTRIEGVQLTNAEIETLLRGIKTYSFRSRDEQEVAGYAELMEIIFSSHKDLSLTENHIKQLHSALLKHSSKDDHHRGEYKKFKNSVEAFGPDGKSKGVVFHTATPFDTPNLMKELVEWTNLQIVRKELHPLLLIAIFVVIFLRIHPFQDGNGRLSRALTTLLLLQLGYSYVPYSSMERVIEENKDAYYLALRRGQSELSGMNDWLMFFLQSMQKQKVALEIKMTSELTTTKLPPLSQQILELIKSRGPTSMAEMLSATGANRNTLKLHCKNLVKNKLIVADGVGRGTRYRINQDFQQS